MKDGMKCGHDLGEIIKEHSLEMVLTMMVDWIVMGLDDDESGDVELAVRKHINEVSQELKFRELSMDDDNSILSEES